MSEATEYTTPFFAVFNSHINNADRRARRAFRERFGPGVWKRQMTYYVRKGIMSVFDDPPNQYTQAYVHLVTQFVNEGVPPPEKTETSE